jgi:hypothetical protein
MSPKQEITPAPLADSALVELERLLALGTKAPWTLHENPKKWVINQGTSDDEWRANRDNDAALVVALRNEGPVLLARLRAAEAAATELVKLREYIIALFNDLLNHPGLPPSINSKLWDHRQQLTVKGGQPNV